MPNKALHRGLLLLLLAIISGCGLGKDLPSVYSNYTHPATKYTDSIYHTVKKGETLSGIALAYNADLRSVISANKLSPPYTIYPNDKITIPRLSYHIVKKDESISVIARKYGVGTRQLVLQNNIKEPYIIYPKQKLFIPAQNQTQLQKHSSTATKTNGTDSNQTSQTSNKPKFLSPIDGEIIASFGDQGGGLYNDGVNFSAELGQSVRTVADGKVIYSNDYSERLGKLILIRHAEGYVTAYAHIQTMLVQRGDSVKQGQTIAQAGQSGKAKRPQLHFQVRKNKQTLNPKSYLTGQT